VLESDREVRPPLGPVSFQKVREVAVALARRASDAVAGQLTFGQRYTAALAVALAVLVLVFGLPERPQPALPAAAAGPATVALVPPAPTAPAPPLVSSAVGPDFGSPPPVSGQKTVAPLAGSIAQPAAPPKIVAVVRQGDGLPGRDDASIASVFLSEAGFSSATRTIDPADASMCDKVAAGGSVALTSLGVNEDLRACLVGRGVTVVSFDERGDLPPLASTAGQVLSTARGTVASLLDLGGWGASSGTLRGKVGLVAASALRDQIEIALSGLRALGVDVAEVAYIADGPDGESQIGDGVRSFAARGIEVVVFALPVDQQRRWVAQQAVIQPGVRFVVSDIAGSILDETYPPTFEGALAHTSLRVPWFRRDHGETPTQEQCRAKWEQTGRTSLGGAELARAFMWCQHVAMTLDALRAVDAGIPFERALRSQRVDSPLTSELGPLADGGYGPTQDAVLVWRTSCGCWVESRAYADRGGRLRLRGAGLNMSSPT
jgi:hypothetical protein